MFWKGPLLSTTHVRRSLIQRLLALTHPAIHEWSLTHVWFHIQQAHLALRYDPAHRIQTRAIVVPFMFTKLQKSRWKISESMKYGEYRFFL